MQSRNLVDFTGRVALVTGATSGIGRAAAVSFARFGAKVAVVDISDRHAAETLADIEKEGGSGIFIAADVSQSADVKAMVERTVASFGRLDCALNNAGISTSARPFAELDQDEFDRVLAIDLKGCMLCMKYELKHMISAGAGAIVNVASVAGLVPEAGSAGYVAAKHGVLGLTKTAALENAHRGIRVNAIAPGWVRTAMTAEWETDKAFHAALKAATPMHRPAEPDEIAAVALFLCSSAAPYLTGQTVAVDGAQTIRGLFPVSE